MKCKSPYAVYSSTDMTHQINKSQVFHRSVIPEKQLINIINVIIVIISTKSFTIFDISKNVNLEYSNY